MSDPTALPDRQKIDAPVQLSGPRYKRMTPVHVAIALQLAAEGRTQAEIASALHCDQSTISRVLQRVTDPKAVIQAIMKAGAIDRLTDWSRASKSASKRGDHRPAREWIEAAHPELRPAQGKDAGPGVVVNIGFLQAPAPATPTTIDVTPKDAA